MKLISSRQDCIEFMRRFGLVGDALIRSVDYKPMAAEATLVLEIQDPERDCDWVNLTMQFKRIQDFYYFHYFNFDAVVVYEIVAAPFVHEGKEPAIFINFFPRAFPDSASEIETFILDIEDFFPTDQWQSCGMISAAEVYWDCVPMEAAD